MVTALDFWITAEGGPRRSGKASVIGQARPAEPGWFSVDLRGTRFSGLDQVESLRLCGPAGPESGTAHPVLEAVLEGETIRFRAPQFADLDDPQLWQIKQPPTHLLVKLREGITGLGDAGLAHDLAAGRLAPAPPVTRQISGFTPAQNSAYSACLGRGVHMVWGPPGTGKTRVITEAIDTLVRDGKRVLLVSATNIAVDNALLGAIKSGRHQRGDLLRVGPPHHPEVMSHADVCLPALVDERLAAVARSRSQIEQQLVGIRAERDELTRLDISLTGFAADAYHLAKRVVAAAAAIPGLALAAADAREASRSARSAAEEASSSLADAERAWEALEPARQAYSRIDDIQQDLIDLEAAADGEAAQALRARHQADLIDAEIQALTGTHRLSRLTNRGRLRRLAEDLSQARSHAEEAQLRAREANELLGRRRRRTIDLARELTDSAGCGRADLDRAESALGTARREATRLSDLADAAGNARETAQQRLLTAEAGGPTEAQRVLVADADRRGLPALLARANMLRTRAGTSEAEKHRLEQQYAKVQEDYTRLSRDAEGEIIRGARLVATTLARLRTSRPLMDGPYDVVLVDEVGAANLPEVLLAVSRATRAAVLLGDFMQLGAIIDNKQVKDSDRPDVKTWLHPSAFAHCRIADPRDAQRHPGCTMLDVQHRFGPEIMELANAIAYDGRLTAGDSVRAHPANDPEIVFIDVDDLGEIARVRPDGLHRGWWPAGALLARVLSDYHQSRGERTGIVTPYGRQVEATLEALRDHETGSSLTTEVGTAHRFQGREFPIVVFDLVEDAFAERWMAKAGRGTDAYLFDGIRLFNVAITRAQHRLYLIGSRSRLTAAMPHSPFGHVARLIEQRRARVVRASQLVSPASTPRDKLAVLAETFTGELAELLAQHVRVSDIGDEREFYATFADHLAAARRSIWLWAPWTTKRVRTILPMLRDAVDRGVHVTLFVRDESDQVQRKPEHQTFLSDLRSVLHTVVEVNVMHQKIVVIDEQVVLLGSLNVLSQSWTREVMVTMRGSHFARKLLDHEHAKDFSRPPPCGACGGNDVALRRRKTGVWFWRCYSERCPRWRPNGHGHWSQDVVFGAAGQQRRAAGTTAAPRRRA
ncbi:AAA domain-containing protein [Catenuloplanes japonicus]|uniref:AAA domain-containing protein n=1 Tax=Catenuloplanes japonicus TaxID=33876 RepID=UPI00068C38E4|nr:AAA domain-containing protein [Catenuloplanes japonicus]